MTMGVAGSPSTQQQHGDRLAVAVLLSWPRGAGSIAVSTISLGK
jgi:hypothetical protein